MLAKYLSSKIWGKKVVKFFFFHPKSLKMVVVLQSLISVTIFHSTLYLWNLVLKINAVQ